MATVQRQAIVIGAGVGGLTAAIALRQIGWDVDVYERTSELRETGAGYNLSPEAMGCLDRLGLGSAMLQCTLPVDAFEYRTWSGQVYGRVELAPVEGHTGAVVDRRALQALLVQTATRRGARLHLGAAFASVQPCANGARVTLNNGASQQAALVVGADGVRSAVRRFVFGDEPYRWAGYYNFRGTSSIPMPEERSIRFVVGRDCHIIACALPGGRSLFSFFLPGTAKDHENWRVSSSAHEQQVMRQALAGCDPEITRLIDNAESLFGSGIHDREPISRYSTEALPMLTLLGDAAHPSTPHLGRGASAAVEDGCALARAVACHDEPAKALTVYEAERQPLTAKAVLAARAIGTLTQSGQVAVNDKLDRLLTAMRAAQTAIAQAATTPPSGGREP